MNEPVLIVGDGFLTQLVHEKLGSLSSLCPMRDGGVIPSQTKLVVLLQDGWEPMIHEEMEDILHQAKVPSLRAFVALGEGVVGPLTEPGVPGCSSCADSRWLMAQSDRQSVWALHSHLRETGGVKQDAWASRNGLVQMAYFIEREVRNFLQGWPIFTQQHLFLLNLKTMKSQLHRFNPDPFCPVCNTTLDDSPEAAMIDLKANPKTSPDSYRTRRAEDLKPILREQYLDSRTGLLNGKWHDLQSPFATVVVNLPLPTGNEMTAGRSHSYGDSELTAILEGLERYCGLMPRGKRTVIHDSYAHLGNQCLNPLSVGAHALDQYNRPDFPFLPFDDKREMSWVWGYSLQKQKPILVPELLAYYSLGGGEGFVYETSNGCAIGGSLVEAVLHGIFEVMERDAFLLTWFARLPIPQIHTEDVDDWELKWMAARFEAVTGYELLLFDMTMEHGVPCIWSMARNKKKDGARLICSAGAHLDPLRAMKSAIHELAGSFPDFSERYQAHRNKSLKMLEDPFLVRDMAHHSLLYSLPEAEDRLGFLLNQGQHSRGQRNAGHNQFRPAMSFASRFQPPTRHKDLTEDLKDMLRTLDALDLDVIVVDQTTPELKGQGLYCVKTLIPGMLPMTFGHHLTRLEGLTRVLTVPMKLGYSERPLRRDELNPYPHPFP